MFTAYFDASGDNSSKFVVAVAGFVASADAWIAWEREWLERLCISHLDALHMSELEKSKNWDLINDLAEITRNHVKRKFAVVVVNREIQSRLSKDDREKLHMNSYALTGRTIAKLVRAWRGEWSRRCLRSSAPASPFSKTRRQISSLTFCFAISERAL